MTPSMDERLASVIRALSDVVLPSLPPEAALAQEQVQLSLGHLQIMRAQLDDAPAFEAEELADAAALGKALADCPGGKATDAAKSELAEAVRRGDAAKGIPAIRQARIDINAAIATLVKSVSQDGVANASGHVSRVILHHEKRRVIKDRRWFAPFGFDTVPAAAE